MKIKDIKKEDFKNNSNLSSKFLSVNHNDFDIGCNILINNFYLDTHNFFPITEDYYTFFDDFNWGNKIKYENFYTKNFYKNFMDSSKKFKTIDNSFILGSSSVDNYYRNMITFLPRLFFNNQSQINLVINRNTSNKFRNFINIISKKMNIKIKFIFLDEGFYKFTNSQFPQFLNKDNAIKILNSLKITTSGKKEKVYITRQNCSSRNLINENDVITKLKKLNFRIVDLNKFNIFDQIKLFSNAEVIVSPTGSALTNIVFCNEGTKIFEISPHYQYDYEETFKSRYKFIAKKLNLKYINIDAEPINIKNIDSKIKNGINSQVIINSNYYKNLILKLEKIDHLII